MPAFSEREALNQAHLRPLVGLLNLSTDALLELAAENSCCFPFGPAPPPPVDVAVLFKQHTRTTATTTSETSTVNTIPPVVATSVVLELESPLFPDDEKCCWGIDKGTTDGGARVGFDVVG